MSWLLQRWQSLVSLFQTPISVRVKDQPTQRSTMAVTSQERLRQLVHSLKQYEQRINRLGQGIAEYYNFSIIGQRKGYSGWLSEELHSGNYVSFHRLSQEIGQLVVQAREVMADREAHGGQADAIGIQIRSLCTAVTSGMERIRVLPVIEAIDTLPASLRKLAQNYNKVVDIALEGQQVLVPREMLGELSALIEHLMTFSLLSSIEPSSTRLKVGKPTRARLMVRFSQNSSRLELEVIDDGAGLDEVRLRSQIFARELLTPIEFECLSRDELMTMAVGWGGTFQYANLEKFRLPWRNPQCLGHTRKRNAFTASPTLQFGEFTLTAFCHPCPINCHSASHHSRSGFP
jgi:chemotaxis protein histidine kinase CheA